MHYLLLTWRDHYLNKLKCHGQNSHKISYGEITSHIIETYKNDVVLHGFHTNKKATDIFMSTMCTFSSDQHDLPHWKFVLRCCAKCLGIFMSVQYCNRDDTNIFPDIYFDLFILLSLCTVHVRHPYEEKNMCIVFHSAKNRKNAKLYT